jgi:hypothetical protein
MGLSLLSPNLGAASASGRIDVLATDGTRCGHTAEALKPLQLGRPCQERGTVAGPERGAYGNQSTALIGRYAR